MVGRRAAHQGDDLIGGHFEVAPSAKAFDELLAPGLANPARRRLDQPNDARLDFEIDIRPWHEARTFSPGQGDRDLPFRGDPHRRRLSYWAK